MHQPCSAACTRPLQQFEVAEVQILQYAALVELLVVTTCNADLVHCMQQCRGIPHYYYSASCMQCCSGHNVITLTLNSIIALCRSQFDGS